jgi:hypothetical protein
MIISDVACPFCKSGPLEHVITLSVPMVHCKKCEKSITCLYCNSRSIEYTDDNVFNCTDCGSKWTWSQDKKVRRHRARDFHDSFTCVCGAKDEIKVDNNKNVYCKKCARIICKNKCPHCNYPLLPITSANDGSYACKNPDCTFMAISGEPKKEKKKCPKCGSDLKKSCNDNYEYVCSKINCDYDIKKKKKKSLYSKCCNQPLAEIWAQCPGCNKVSNVHLPLPEEIHKEGIRLDITFDEWQKYIRYKQLNGRELEFLSKLNDYCGKIQNRLEDVFDKFDILQHALEIGTDPTEEVEGLDHQLQFLHACVQRLSDVQVNELEEDDSEIFVYDNDEFDSFENYRIHTIHRDIEFIKHDIRQKPYSVVEIEEDTDEPVTIKI